MKTFKLVHKHPELENKPIGVFQCVLFVDSLCHKKVDINVSVVFYASLAINTALAR